MQKATTTLGDVKLVALFLLFLISLFYSKAGLSIFMGLFLLYGLWVQKDQLGTQLRAFFKSRAFAGLLLVCIVYLFSGINSDDTQHWLKQVRIKLPFLLLPLSFFLVREKVAPTLHKWVHITLGVVGSISTLPVLLDFIGNKEEMIAAIGRGHYIPTPIDHIHYSIILAYSALGMLLLLADGCVKKSKLEKWLMAILPIWLTLFLHILAVRSGLAILYLGFAFVIAWYIYSSRKYWLASIGLLGLIFIPFTMYKTVPSLQKKIHYMVHDYHKYKSGEGKDYSDSERLMSYSIAAELIKESPIVGHGIGDLYPLMVSKHKEKYGEKKKYIFPHNQYLYVLAGAGVIGFIFFFLGILSPILFSRPDPYVWLIYIAMLASFMVENTVQRAVSIAFFLFFILLNLARSKRANCEV